MRRCPTVALLALAVAASSCGGAGGSGSTRNGPIVFSSLGDGGLSYGIYRVDSDGSNLRQLTHGRRIGADFSAVPSPAGDLVAFVRRNALEPSASETYRLMVVPTTGGKPTQVLEMTEDDGAVLTWSSDPPRIVFEGDQVLVGVAPSDRRRRVLFSTAKLGYDACCPSWSPAGSTIAFLKGADQEIWRVDADGGGAQRVTDAPAPLVDVDPSWSPDGEQVVFERANELSPTAHPPRLKIVDAAGGAPRTLIVLKRPARPLTDVVLESESSHPSWSPDGRLIAFYDERGGKRGIFTVPVDGGRPRFVVAGAAPRWAPSGS